MQINSVENKVLWYAALLAVCGETALIFAFRGVAFACVWFCLAMLLLNMVTFLEGTAKHVMQVLSLLAVIAALILVPRWFSGSLSLFLLSASFHESKHLMRGLGLLTTVGAIVVDSFYSSMDVIAVLLSCLFALAIYVAWVLFLFFIRRNQETEERLNQALTNSAVDAMEQRKLREELAKAQVANEHNARLQERERISRDIHNQVGHTLSAATVTLDAATMLLPSDQERALEKIDVANSRVHEAISSVRSVVRTLDAADDRIALPDYMKSLESMVHDFMLDTEIKVYHNFSQIESEQRIPIQQASFLSSSLQELLTNGVKHGQATIFVVTFLNDEKNIRLKVQDNGSGWGEVSAEEKRVRINKGFGLRKMIDYAEKHGGNCTIDSIDGFVVSLSLPMEE